MAARPNGKGDQEMSRNSEDPRLDAAMFRYRVIAPLLDLAGPARMAEVRRLAAKPWVIPGTGRTRVAEGTILHWLRSWRSGGLDALKPRPRSDRGKSRRLTAEAAELLISIRTEHPGLSVKDAVARAERTDGFADPVSLSAAYRLFRAEGLMNPQQAPQGPEALCPCPCRRPLAVGRHARPEVRRRTPSAQNLHDRHDRRRDPPRALVGLRLLRGHQRLPAGVQAGPDPARDPKETFLPTTEVRTGPGALTSSAPVSASH